VVTIFYRGGSKKCMAVVRLEFMKINSISLIDSCSPEPFRMPNNCDDEIGDKAHSP
jgi:hypothetical protein